MLGVIREVNEYDMVISLPNGLSGFVHITHINEKITERLKEVLKADDSKDSEVTTVFREALQKGGGGYGYSLLAFQSDLCLHVIYASCRCRKLSKIHLTSIGCIVPFKIKA